MRSMSYEVTTSGVVYGGFLTKETKSTPPSIWVFAFGYFAAYVPYTATTKSVTAGWIDGQEMLSGFSVAPVSVLASVIGMYVFITSMGWWKHASRRTIGSLSVPMPSGVTFVSGLLTAGIVVTTTLAYTFTGVSIVFMMLLMRGGVLILAPIIDSLTGRTPRWFSWMGLALSLGALVVAFSEQGGFRISVIAIIDVAVYLSCYFFRLQFMSRFAKSSDDNASRRYFVEEQMVATPALLVVMVVLAIIGPAMTTEGSSVHEILMALRFGFTGVWSSSVWIYIVMIGIFSQFTGIFGGLVLLDKRENTFCVPVNRCSSILAGVVASYVLLAIFDTGAPSTHKLIGAAMIGCAILFLTIPPMLEKARAKKAAAKG